MTKTDGNVAVAEAWSKGTKTFGKNFTHREDIYAKSQQEARERYIEMKLAGTVRR